MKFLKKSILLGALFAICTSFADTFTTPSTLTGEWKWPNITWEKTEGSSVRTAPAAGDTVYFFGSGGYNDVASFKNMPALNKLELMIYGDKSISGTFTVDGDFIYKSGTVLSGDKLVASSVDGKRSHVAFATGWSDGGNTSIYVNGNFWICDYATDRGDCYTNLGGRQSSEHVSGNFLYNVKVKGNLNIVNQTVFLQTVNGTNAEVEGQLAFPEIVNGRFGTFIVCANNKIDDSGVLTQTIKVGGISSISGSAPVIANRTGAVSNADKARLGIIEITGEGGTFYGSIKDGLSATDTLGKMSLIMNGTGTQILQGESEFTGAITVNSGKLLMTSTKTLGEITVNNGGTFGAIQAGLLAKKLNISETAIIEFDLSQYRSFIELSEGLTIANIANLPNNLSFKIIGGQREYRLFTDKSDANTFSALNGVEKIYTDSNSLSQMGRFVARDSGLYIIFPDATPLPDSPLPTDGSFLITPLFEGVIAPINTPVTLVVANPPAGASYKITRDLGATTIQTGNLVAEEENRITFTPTISGQYELFCNNVFEANSPGADAQLHRFAFMVAPEQISMPVERPADFDKYWAARKAEVEAVEPIFELQFKSENAAYTLYTFDVKVDGYDLYAGNYADTSNTRLNLCGIVATGYIAIPKGQGDGPFPAVVTFYGAGSYGADERDATAYAQIGMIGVSMNPHPIKQSMINDSAQATLKDRLTKETSSTWYYRDRCIDTTDPKNIYFNGMFKRCYQTLRATMAMTTSTSGITLPKWDGKNLATRGFSQGGAQTVAAAYLCPQVTVMTPWCPAMCDLAGRKYGQTVNMGWPGWIQGNTAQDIARQELTQYFDMGLMSASIQAKSCVAAGLIDGTCHPILVTAMFNNIKTSQKEFVYMQRTAHGTNAEFEAAALKAIKDGITASNSGKTSYNRWAAKEGLWGDSALPEAKTNTGANTNLERYVFGANPQNAVKTVPAAINETVSLNYTPQSEAENVQITPLWSENLKDWNSDNLTVSPDGNGGYNVKKTGPQPDNIFFKLRLEKTN